MQGIQAFYQTFKIDNFVMGTWFKVLQNFEFWKVEKNLQEWVVDNRFPPTIHDLVYDAPKVLTAEETTKQMESDRERAERLVKQLENGDTIKL
ncbi:hypothetical protein PBC5_060 [Bacillus phage PBC5]|nr:hypothetical protein PBC5_060 [Bacillus phage PBC5]